MEDQMIRKLLNWRNWGWKADRLRSFFPPLLSIIVPVGIQKKWESARDVQQWIFFRGRESIPKRVINALLATVRCSFTARKSDLKEHWPRNYAFLKRKSFEKKKKATTRSSNVGFLSFILNKSGTLLFTFIERKSIVRGNFWKDGTRVTRCWYLLERKERYLILKRWDFIKLYIVWKS